APVPVLATAPVQFRNRGGSGAGPVRRGGRGRTHRRAPATGHPAYRPAADAARGHRVAVLRGSRRRGDRTPARLRSGDRTLPRRSRAPPPARGHTRTQPDRGGVTM